MFFQCTFCDNLGKTSNDPIFDSCKANHHEIMKMLDPEDSKNVVKKGSVDKKTIRKKVKGSIGEFYVESIVIDGKPYFLCASLQNNILSTRDIIETEEAILTPVVPTECGYIPYEFTGSEIVGLNEKIEKGELYDEIRGQIDRYISARELDKNLVLGDILLSYGQEWISTLHYPFFVGENESGKSTVLHLAKWLCYRCHFSEDIPYADIYNFLGTDEEGTGTIAEDEAQEIWKNRQKIRMYKSSYAKGSSKAIILGVDSLGKRQVYYRTFCPKWFSGERVPQDKGFQERLAIVHMVEGQPQSNIKRVSAEEIEKLRQLRNRLLVWKLQNMKYGLPKIDSGLEQRDQELWEDYLRTASDTKYYEKFKKVVHYYTDQRHKAIKNSLEAKLLKLVLDKVDVNLELKFEEYWNYLTVDNPEFPGKLDDRTSKTFYSDEFSEKITYQLISKIFDFKFQAGRQSKVTREGERQHKVTFYSFKREVIEKLVRKYQIELPINTPFYVGQLGQQPQQQQEIATQVDQVNQDNKEEMKEEKIDTK